MKNFKDYAEAYDKTMQFYRAYKIIPSGSITNGRFMDTSNCGPYPNSQYYASDPLVSRAMYGRQNKGIYHGEDVAPKKKYLHSLMTWNNINGGSLSVLADVLLYYPFVDLSVTDEQLMENTVPLPRYTSGVGVQMVGLCQGSPSVTQNIQVKYTNSDGVSGRITPVIATFNSTTAVNGVSLTSSFAVANPNNGYFYLPLQGNDNGVKLVESVTCLTGDTGLMVIALIKPLAMITTTALSQITEKHFAKDFGLTAPIIEDNAYLTFFVQAGASTLNGTIHHYFFETITGD
jgi:hypothetical protein